MHGIRLLLVYFSRHGSIGTIEGNDGTKAVGKVGPEIKKRHEISFKESDQPIQASNCCGMSNFLKGAAGKMSRNHNI